MDKYHLLWVLERIRIKKQPSFEFVIIPFGFFTTGLLAFLTSNFKDFIGVKAEVWQSVILLLTWLSGLATLILFGWWLFNKICRREKTPLEIVDEIIDQMEKDRENLALRGKQNDSR